MNGPYGLPGHGAPVTPFQPGGYLTLVSGSPVITSDQASKTVVFYAQDQHNAVPIIRDGNVQAVYFDEPQLVLTADHALNTIVDVFAAKRDGKGHLVTGPAWTNSGAGAGDRGTAGGLPLLTRAAGMLVNKWGIPGLNGAGSMFIEPMGGTYLGSLFIDGVAGQVTCHRAWGQSRKWGVWNAYNRKRLYLKAGDATATWAYSTAVIRASNNAAANSLTVFTGLAEEYFDLRFDQRGVTTAGNGVIMTNGIGWNSSTVMSGRAGITGHSDVDAAQRSDAIMPAHFLQVPALGINVVTALELGNGTNTATWHGGEDEMVLAAQWWG